VICDALCTVYKYENEDKRQAYGHYNPTVCKENSIGSTGNTAGDTDGNPAVKISARSGQIARPREEVGNTEPRGAPRVHE
jgi:hypothetical protein